jgi:hypothetical protein
MGPLESASLSFISLHGSTASIGDSVNAELHEAAVADLRGLPLLPPEDLDQRVDQLRTARQTPRTVTIGGRVSATLAPWSVCPASRADCSSRSAGAMPSKSASPSPATARLHASAPKPLHPALSHQRSTSASPPIRANPDAIDSSSAPVDILAGSKRASNMARTAGTNDEPPVRKTRSI